MYFTNYVFKLFIDVVILFLHSTSNLSVVTRAVEEVSLYETHCQLKMYTFSDSTLFGNIVPHPASELINTQFFITFKYHVPVNNKFSIDL